MGGQAPGGCDDGSGITWMVRRKYLAGAASEPNRGAEFLNREDVALGGARHDGHRHSQVTVG